MRIFNRQTSARENISNIVIYIVSVPFTMPITRSKITDGGADKVTPSPPARPETPGSQKPAYIAARTPTTSKIRALNISSTPARKACSFLQHSLEEASSRKRGRRKHEATEPVSPTQAAVDRHKRPRLSMEEARKAIAKENASGTSPFAVEITTEEAMKSEEISPLQLDGPGTTHPTADGIAQTSRSEAVESKAEGAAEIADPIIEPHTPAPRRRGRPPKKVSLGSDEKPITKIVSPERSISPTLAAIQRKQQIATDKSREKAAESQTHTQAESQIKAQAEPPAEAETVATTNCETDRRTKLQMVANKLGDSENVTINPTKISNELADLIESSSTSQLAADMAQLEASTEVRQKLFHCIIIALLSKGAVEGTPTVGDHLDRA
ncbi:hypothetical protein TWF281_004450 [Arthrobotrys megalospora]